MATDYCRGILRVCVAQLCQNLGWHNTQSTPLELLTNVLERYLLELGKVSHRYSEQCKDNHYTFSQRLPRENFLGALK